MTGPSRAERFVAQRSPHWRKLDQLLQRPHLRKSSPEEISLCFSLHRDVSADLVRARSLGCSPEVQSYLSALVSRSQSAAYAETGSSWLRIGALLSREFPAALRQNVRLFLLANVLFWFPLAITLTRSLLSQTYAASILPLEMLEQMSEAYQGDLGAGRTPGGSAAMAGFYVYNNVGIAFRCFATGILFGVGSAFFLVYNGAVTGAVIGHVIRTGGGPNILTFVAGHAPLELTAIVVAGGAGLQMGQALVVTGGRTRLRSLYDARDKILAQVMGAAFMLLLAAAIEGFWSPAGVAAPVKWAVGGIMSLLVCVYFGAAGRQRANARSR